MDVDVSNNYVFVAASSGLLIVNISNADELRETAFIDLPGAIGAIAVTGNYACIAAGEQGLHIVDISDSENPALVGTYDSPGFAEDVVLRGSYAYVADGHEGLRIVDISNPANPQEIGVYRTGTSYVESVAVSGDYAYLADSLRGFRIVDISDNTRPKKIGDLDVAGTSDGIDVSGDWVYIADGTGGLRIITVEDKETPYQVHTYVTPGYAHAVVATVDRAYVADGTNGLLVLDMTTKTSPRIIDTYDTSGKARDLVLASGFTYVADYNRGMRVISMDHPGTFSEVGSYDNYGQAYGLALVGDLLYVADGLAGLRILDTTDPHALEEVGYIDTPGTAHRVEVQGDYAFVVDTHYQYNGYEGFECSENENRNCGLHIFDVSNPARPLWVASYETPGQTAGLTVAGDYVYIADGYEGLRVLDISNPAHPREVGSYDTYGYADDVEVRQVADGHLYAYMADGDRGLRIIDVTDPEAPEGVGSYDTEWAYDLEVVSDTLLFMADYNRIYMLNITDPAEPTIIYEAYSFESGEDYIDLEISDKTILIASRNYGVQSTVYNVGGMTPIRSSNFNNWNSYAISIKGDFQFISSAYWGSIVKTITYGNYHGSLYENQMENMELVGNFAYTVDNHYGLAIFDVSDPVRTVLRGTYSYGYEEYAIAVQGDYAYMGNYGSFGVVDINDPADPVLVGEVDVCYYHCYYFDIEVSGDYAFLTDGHYIITVDISDPTDPEIKWEENEVCATHGGHYCDDVYDLEIHGNYLYAVNDDVGLFTYEIESDGSLTYLNEDAAYYHNYRGLTVTDDYIFVTADEVLMSYSRDDPSDPVHLGTLYDCCGNWDVIVDDNYAYVAAQESGVWIVNITDPENMQKQSSTWWSGQHPNDVEIRGDLLYVAGENTDLVVIDVSNRSVPSWPGQESSFDTSGNANDIEVVGDYTYVADSNYGLTVLDTSVEGSPQQVTRNYSNGTYVAVDVVGSYAYLATSNGLKIIDITTPSTPEEVGWLDGSDYQEVMVVGSTAYVVAGNSGLRVIDISEPENPQETGSYDTYGYALDVVVQGDYAYVADASYGLRVIDISSNPTEAGYYDTHNAYGIDVRGNYVYLADYDEESIYVIDVSDPRSPQFISQYGVGESAYDVSVNGDYAYVASSSNGLKIIDVSEPTSLVEAGHINTPGTARRIMVTGDFVYIADNHRGIRIVDAYYTVNQQQQTYLSAGDARSITLYNDYAFMANYELGLTIENIGTPSNPYRVSILEEADHALDLDYGGGYVTIANEIRGVQIVDVWTPSAPILDGTLPLDTGSISHLVVENDFAYITGNNPDFRIVDISDTVDPLESGSLSNTGSGDLTVSGNTAYVAGSSGVKAIDVSDSTSPQDTGNYGNNVTTDVVIKDGYAYCSSSGGLQVISLSNSESASQETEGQAHGVALEGDYAFIADSIEGIVVFKVSDPMNPQRVGTFHTPAARHMVIRDNYLYLADAEAGLLVLYINYEGNQRPSATISSIKPNPAYEGEDIYFVGSGSDPDGTIEGYQWRSSRDGILSSSVSFYTDSLSIGIHTIYFKVKDNASIWSTEITKQLTIKSRGGGDGDGGGDDGTGGPGGGGSGGGDQWAPVATISSIEPNPANEGETVNFSGYGFDPNGTITAYFWRSSLDGPLSNQSNFSANNLSAGVHLIYFRVQNETGIWSEERSLSLEINAIFASKEIDDSFIIPKNMIYGAGALIAVSGVGYILRSGILSKK